MIKFFKKYHKWLSLLMTPFLILFAISGIVLNHRALFSSIEINRNLLPAEYQYKDWNNAAVKGSETIAMDSILIYGNIGIWLTDTTYTEFSDFNSGFPKGIDNRKVCKIFKTTEGSLLAGTLFGLFQFDQPTKQWEKIPLDLHNPRIVDITQNQDTIIILSRSYLLKSTDLKTFSKHTLPPPENYDNKIGLFKTLWVIHSGEIYGNIGKLFVDLIALIFLFLIVTGLIFFINRFAVKTKNKEKTKSVKEVSRWSLKWHNKIGWTTIFFLTITTITGMFLRPPLLIAIADAKVKKIPYTLLDTQNAWFDKLRRIEYDKKNDQYIIATTVGIYHSDTQFSKNLVGYQSQPPVSVMGVNVFEKITEHELLIGSFEGLFLWNSKDNQVFDYVKKEPYKKDLDRRSPLGEYLITGYVKDFSDAEIFFDFNKGAISSNPEIVFSPMPLAIKNQPMSLWNVMLEVHTARIYQSIVGAFYLLIVPLSGILTIFILVSGFVVWYKKFRRRKKNKTK